MWNMNLRGHLAVRLGEELEDCGENLLRRDM